MKGRAKFAFAAMTLIVAAGLSVGAIQPAVADGGETLADCISDALAPDTAPADLTTLNCTDYTDVTTLNGIQDLTGLTSVTIVGAAGADGDLSPLSSLTNLQNLTVESFGVTDASVVGDLTGLTTVDLAHNGLSSLPALSVTVGSLDVSYNDFSDASTIATDAGLSQVYVEGNHLATLTGLRACETYDATDQTLTLGAATVGVATALPTVEDGNGDSVPVTVTEGSAVSGAIADGSVTWQSPGTGTLGWQTSFHPTACDVSAQFSGTFTQVVAAAPPPAAAAPSVTGINPHSGSTAGGTLVTVRGSGFTGATRVAFGSIGVIFTVDSDSAITASAPPSALARTVDVTVTTPAGASATDAGDRFTYLQPPPPPAPTADSVTPDSGTTSGGTSVIITGDNFTGATSVTFGGADASSFVVTSDSSITAVAEPHAAGYAAVAVTTAGGTNIVQPAFAFLSPSRPLPTALVLSPSHGSQLGGTLVSLSGRNLVNVSQITVGGEPVVFTSHAPNASKSATSFSFTFVTPGSALSGSAKVVVTTVVGSGSTSFSYANEPRPSGLTASPTHGPQLGGQSVSITGQHIQHATKVTIGGREVQFTEQAPRIKGDTPTITLTTPGSGIAGSAPIIVSTIVGSASVPFTYDRSQRPTRLALMPEHASQLGNQTLDLTGQYIANATSVSIGGVDVEFTEEGPISTTGGAGGNVATGTYRITFAVPARVKAGPSSVVVSTLVGTGTVPFTYDKAQPPTALRADPLEGTQLGGTSVTLTGDNLAQAITVSVGGVSVPFQERSEDETADGAKTILFTTPGRAKAGSAPIVVTTIAGSGSTAFSYLSASAPSGLRLMPDHGEQTGQLPVTLTGVNIGNATAVTIGGVAVTFAEHRSQTTGGFVITFNTPGSVIAGGALVVVKTVVGSASVQFSYDRVKPPADLKVTPATGTQLGGETLTVTGQNLAHATGVTVGGTRVGFEEHSTNPDSGSVVSTITFTTPGSPFATSAPIVVSTILGSSTIAFTYVR